MSKCQEECESKEICFALTLLTGGTLSGDGPQEHTHRGNDVSSADAVEVQIAWRTVTHTNISGMTDMQVSFLYIFFSSKNPNKQDLRQVNTRRHDICVL